MNKLTLFIALVFSFACFSCDDGIETIEHIQTKHNVTISGQMFAPAMQNATRAADLNAQITVMYVLIFDENGMFKRKVKVEPGAVGKEETSFEMKNGKFHFHFQTETSASPVILHFIANYTNIPIVDDEISLSKILTTHDVQQTYYWQRIQLNEITKSSSIGHLRLIRNTAKISVHMANDIDYFEYEGFVVCNKANEGTILPLNYNRGYLPPQSNHFAQFVDDNGLPLTYKELTEQHYIGCLPLNAKIDTRVPDMNDFTTEDKRVFENPWSKEKGTYIIIKGKYGGQVSYYKLDLGKHQETPYNVLRNFHYNINITKVRNRGISNIKKAMESPASNMVDFNTNLSSNPLLYISCGKKYFDNDGVSYFNYKYLFNKRVSFQVESKEHQHVTLIKKGEKYVNPNANEYIKYITLQDSYLGRIKCSVFYNETDGKGNTFQEGSSQKLILLPDEEESNAYEIEFIKQDEMPYNCLIMAEPSLVWQKVDIKLWINLRGDQAKNKQDIYKEDNTNWDYYHTLSQIPNLFPIRFEIEPSDNRVICTTLPSYYDAQRKKMYYLYYMSYERFMANTAPMAGDILNFYSTSTQNKVQFTIRCNKFFKQTMETDVLDLSRLDFN